MLKMEKVHEDYRGEIYVITGLEKDIVVNTTKKGYARGGCYHTQNDEHFVVVKGMVRLFVDTHEEVYHPGMTEYIPKGSPHMMKALTDCVTMEWGSTLEEKGTYDEKFRNAVERINKEKHDELQNQTG